MSEIEHTIANLVTKNPIIVFMKGNKLWPACGFSAKAIDILNHYGVDYETVDILKDEALRQALKEYSSWPTFPQVYINGEFIGGCDILTELHETEQLTNLLKA